MVSIGLFELTWHPQNLRALVEITDPDRYDVTVFTSEEIYDNWFATDDFEATAYSFHLRAEDESLESYFRAVESICEDRLDFLMVLTPFGSGTITAHFVEFDPDCPKVTWIYNSQACIDSTHAMPSDSTELGQLVPRLRRSLDGDPKTAERSLKPLRYYLRPFILDNYDGYIVEYPPIRDHLAGKWNWDRPIHTFAPVVYRGDESASFPGTDRVRVTVSGRVVENVRDYDLLLDAFEEIFARYGDAVGLTLLGRPVGGYGDRIMERCREFVNRGYRVRAYPDTDWIPTAEFDRVLAESDVLCNPIYLVEETTREPAPDEIRGTTKGTGVVFDALRYGKPLVLPSGFTVDSMIEGATLTFGTGDELVETIGRLLDDPDRLHDFQAAAMRHGVDFDLANQRDRFDGIVQSFLDER